MSNLPSSLCMSLRLSARQRLRSASPCPSATRMPRQLIDFATQAETLGVAEIRLAPEAHALALCPSQASADAFANGRRARLRHLKLPTRAPESPPAPARRPAPPATSPRATLPPRSQPSTATFSIGSLDASHFRLRQGLRPSRQAALTLVGGENGAGLVVDGTAQERCRRLHGRARLARAFSGMSRPGRGEKYALARTAPTCLSRLGKDRIAEAFRKRMTMAGLRLYPRRQRDL